MEFRKLKADEIDVRVGQIGDDYISLLLYKDARCDMNILDETVGAENWQRNHEVINGNLFCNVGILFNGQWVWKQDVGTESNTEKEKGEASDSFKRACFCWGIGRELYTAPRIYFSYKDVNVYNKKCNDKFVVTQIAYDGNVISELTILDTKTNKSFSYNSKNTGSTKKSSAKTKPVEEKKQEDKLATQAQLDTLHQMAEKYKFNLKMILDANKCDESNIERAQAEFLITELTKKYEGK